MLSSTRNYNALIFLLINILLSQNVLATPYNHNFFNDNLHHSMGNYQLSYLTTSPPTHNIAPLVKHKNCECCIDCHCAQCSCMNNISQIDELTSSIAIFRFHKPVNFFSKINSKYTSLTHLPLPYPPK